MRQRAHKSIRNREALCHDTIEMTYILLASTYDFFSMRFVAD